MYICVFVCVSINYVIFALTAICINQGVLTYSLWVQLMQLFSVGIVILGAVVHAIIK